MLSDMLHIVHITYTQQEDTTTPHESPYSSSTDDTYVWRPMKKIVKSHMEIHTVLSHIAYKSLAYGTIRLNCCFAYGVKV